MTENLQGRVGPTAIDVKANRRAVRSSFWRQIMWIVHVYVYRLGDGLFSCLAMTTRVSLCRVFRRSRVETHFFFSSTIGEAKGRNNVARGWSIAPRTGVGYSISLCHGFCIILRLRYHLLRGALRPPSLSLPVFFIPPAPSKRKNCSRMIIMIVQKRIKKCAWERWPVYIRDNVVRFANKQNAIISFP